MTRNTVRKVFIVAAAVAGLTMGGAAGTAAADHGDDDFGFDDHGRFDDRLFFDRGFDCPGPFCVVFDDGRHGGRGHH